MWPSQAQHEAWLMVGARPLTVSLLVSFLPVYKPSAPVLRQGSCSHQEPDAMPSHCCQTHWADAGKGPRGRMDVIIIRPGSPWALVTFSVLAYAKSSL